MSHGGPNSVERGTTGPDRMTLAAFVAFVTLARVPEPSRVASER